MFRNDLDYRAISREVEQKLTQQKRRLQIEGLAGHVILYVIMVWLAAYLHWFTATGNPALIFFMAWLVGLLIHTGALFVSLGRRDTQLREQLLQKAIQDAIVRLGQGGSLQERMAAMQLSEDGELIDIEDDYIEDEKPKRAEY